MKVSQAMSCTPSCVSVREEGRGRRGEDMGNGKGEREEVGGRKGKRGEGERRGRQRGAGGR